MCFQKCRLLILCTASNRAVIDDLELAPAFSTVLHVSPLMRGEDVFAVIQSLDGAFADGEVRTLGAKLAGKRYACLSALTTIMYARRCMVGVKKLLDIIDLVKQPDEGNRVPMFLCKMEEEGGLE